METLHTATPPVADREQSEAPDWTIDDAAALYRIRAWGDGYFDVNSAGHVAVRVGGEEAREIDLHDVVEGLRARDLGPPLVLHFTDILNHRLKRLNDAFADAIRENDYKGRYTAVYPIKVNQRRAVVESIFRNSGPFAFGLEVGSKPELLVVMAVSCESPDRIIICNGFKDDAYIEAAILATKLGRTIYPVVENMRELELILKHAARYQVRPRIGVRVKLSAPSVGRWRDSVGERAKFGLHFSEVLSLFERLQKAEMADCLKLVHCHAGSQIQDINALKNAVNELAQVYAELAKMGAGLECIDVGGGLGVDYDGSQSSSHSSINYTLDEYASNIVYRIRAVCDDHGVRHPNIISESGRAIATYQSVLVFDVIGSARPGSLASRMDLEKIRASEEGEHQPIRDLVDALRSITPDRLEECYHDAVQAREQALQLFSLGYLGLRGAAYAEQLFWAACQKINALCGPTEELAEDIADLPARLCASYFCNFSLFQSLPDVWAIDKLFPIMPIHRLDERPTQPAVLADLTCDSDGKIGQFIGDGDARPTLDVHPLREDEPYTLGAFLIGAYQDILGDLHNLFGDNHVVHIRADGDGSWWIEDYIKGDTAADVLGYVQYDTKRLYAQLDRDCETAVRAGRLTLDERRALLSFYESELNSYTYLRSR